MLSKVSSIVGPAAFAAGILALILAFGKPYPVWETWYAIPLWEAFRTGGDWPALLFTSRWGHICAIPTGINLVIGHLTDFRMRDELLFQWGVAVVAFFAIYRPFMRGNAFVVTAAAALYFTARAAEIWLNSFNLVVTLSLALTGAVGMCLAGRPTVLRTALATLLAFAGILTAGQGLAAVLAGFVPAVLWVIADRRTWPLLVAWALVAALCISGFTLLAGHGAGVLQVAIDSGFPSFAARLVALTVTSTAPVLLGAAVVAAVAVVWGANLRHGGIADRDVLFWSYMLAYVAVMVVLIALARSSDGTSLRYRYLVQLWPLYVGGLVLADRLAGQRRIVRAGVAVAAAAVIAAATQLGVAHARALKSWEPLSEPTLHKAASDPAALQPADFLRISSNDEPVTAKGLEIMRRMRVNVFAP